MTSLSDRLDFEPEYPTGENHSPRHPAEACRLTAVNTGGGRTVLLSLGEAAGYRQNIAAYIDEYQPVGLRECQLVQALSDTMWRLQRTQRLEMAIFAQGAVEFDGAFDDHPALLRPQMIELQTFLKYEKQLRNLQLQESRLQRRYEKDSAELRILQKERSRKEEAEEAIRIAEAQTQKDNAAHANEPKTQKIAAATPVTASQSAANPKNGFEFSTVVTGQPASDLPYASTRHSNCT